MHRRLLLTLLLLGAITAACAPASPDEPEPGDSPLEPGATAPGSLSVEATCTANDLANYNFCQDGTCSPTNYQTGTSTTPLLNWEAASCQPDAYKVRIHAFPNMLIFEGFAPIDPNTNMLVTALQVISALDPGGHYSWSVSPILDGQEYWTPNARVFFTGPVCTAQDLLAPDLVSPVDNATIANQHPPLIISYAPACNPNTFIREMDTSPSFNGPNLMPGPGVGPFLGQIPMNALQDCTMYYWRARATIQGDSSPWSSTFSFETNFDGNCVTQPPLQVDEVEQPMVTFDTPLFYYGGSCAPQQVGVMIKLDVEDIYNVVLFHRLHNRETGEKTEWVAVSMTDIGDGYYERMVYATDIPEAAYTTSSFFQVQIVATDADGNHIFRSDVIFEDVELMYCGGTAPTEAPTLMPPVLTPTPRPTPRE